MLKRILYITVICIFTFSLAGCVTVRKSNLGQQGLRNQIQALEAQLKDKDQEIMSLRDAIAREIQQKEELNRKVSSAKFIGEVRSRPNVKQIQTALKNAGYDPGSIDGKIGRRTREAIRAFQKANNLAVDGKAGKLTWNLLRNYLYKKEK